MDWFKSFHLTVEIMGTLVGYMELFKVINYFSIGIGIYFNFAVVESLLHFNYSAKTLELSFFLTLINYYLIYLHLAYITLSSFPKDFEIS